MRSSHPSPGRRVPEEKNPQNHAGEKGVTNPVLSVSLGRVLIRTQPDRPAATAAVMQMTTWRDSRTAVYLPSFLSGSRLLAKRIPVSVVVITPSLIMGTLKTGSMLAPIFSWLFPRPVSAP